MMVCRKAVLIMDEVDGMSAGDRGGVADLIASIKVSKIPIICICNDRYSQKLRSLVNYCLPLNFRKPTKQQAWHVLKNLDHKILFFSNVICQRAAFMISNYCLSLSCHAKREGLLCSGGVVFIVLRKFKSLFLALLSLNGEQHLKFLVLWIVQHLYFLSVHIVRWLSLGDFVVLSSAWTVGNRIRFHVEEVTTRVSMVCQDIGKKSLWWVSIYVLGQSLPIACIRVGARVRILSPKC